MTKSAQQYFKSLQFLTKDMCWKSPFSVILVWPNIPVKNYFARSLLEDTNHCLSVRPENNV